MKTLLRLCSAAVVTVALTACGEVPTSARPDVAPARRDGGVTIGGGYRTSDGDTAVVNTISGNEATCVEDARGGWTAGGGHYVETPTC